MTDTTALIKEARRDPNGHAERLRQLAEWARMDLDLPSVGERLDVIADALEAAEARTEELESGRYCPQCHAGEWGESNHQRRRAERAETQLKAVRELYKERCAETVEVCTDEEDLFLADLRDILDGVDREQETPHG